MYIYLYIVSCFLLAGCAYNDFTLFKYNLSNNSSGQSSNTFNKGDNNQTEILSFKSYVTEPSLHSLIEKGLSNSPIWETQLAHLDVIKKKAGLSLTEELPSLHGSVGWKPGKKKTHETDFNSMKLPEWQSGASFAWELDLWGKWKALREAETSSVKAESHLVHAAQLQFIYEISKIWYTMRFLNEEIELITAQIRQHHEIHTLHLHRFHQGLENNSSIMEMEIALKLLVTEFNQLERAYGIEENKIKSLVGSHDTEVLVPHGLSNSSFPKIPVMDNSSVLKNRPDVHAGENKLHAQIKRHKASLLDLYPSLGLNLSGVGMSGDLSDPFREWIVQGGPVINIPLWSPKKMLKVEEDESQIRAAEIEWKAVILRAVEEIEIAKLIQLSTLENFDILNDVANQFTELYQIEEQKYTVGLTSKAQLLATQIKLTIEKRRALKSRYNLWVSYLNLGKSLGISWLE